MTVSENNHPTIRVRNQRTGQWIELPDKIPGYAVGLEAKRNHDGKIIGVVPKLFLLETIEAAHRSNMSHYDNLSPEKRWEVSYLPNPDKTTPPRWLGKRRGARVTRLADLSNLL